MAQDLSSAVQHEDRVSFVAPLCFVDGALVVDRNPGNTPRFPAGEDGLAAKGTAWKGSPKVASIRARRAAAAFA
jgi:hypothetical protein